MVVVGGGFGGLNAARALAGQPVRVTLLDRRNHHNRFLVLFEWAWAYVSWQRGARLITRPWRGRD